MWLLMTICMTGCTKVCNKDLLLGDILLIPIDLSAYIESEVAAIYVWNINNGDTTNWSFRDHYLFQNRVGEQNWLTDNETDGFYSSDLDGSSLYFYFLLSDTTYQLLDSITTIVIKKSQGDAEDMCYQDHPNIRIDAVQYEHAGQALGKKDIIVLSR